MRKITISIVFLLILAACFKSKKIPEKEDIKKENNQTKEIIVINYSKKQLELKKYFELYLEQLENLDTESIIEMTYPKFFITINKTIFKHYINTLLTSSHIAIESFDTNITDISKVQKFDNGEFAQLKYRTSIKLAFIDPNLYNDELSLRVLNDVLKDKYGKENIEINDENRTIIIRKDEKLLSIKEKEMEWKFIGDNKEYRRLYPQFLPLDILSKI